MNILQFMQTELVTAQSHEPLISAVEALAAEGIHHLPILDGDRLVGMVTDTDIKQACPSPLIEGSETAYAAILRDTPLRRIMRAVPTTVGPDARIADVARLMISQGIRAVPVVDGHKLLGILTETDMLRVLLSLLKRPS